MAAVRLCRAALPAMKNRKWGRIINVLNIGAKAPRAEGAPTVVSRAAGLALTKVLASDGAHNVLVNALMVGIIKSAQWALSKRQTKRIIMRTSLSKWQRIGTFPWGASAKQKNLLTSLAS